MSGYSVFIRGETIDLCVPSRLAIERDGWADWFNDLENIRFLDQGVFPNFIEDQYEFLNSLRDRSRLALLIKPKDRKNVIGIVSLSTIKWVARSAQIAMVIGRRDESTRGKLHALEAMARMTEHGFETLGLDRVWAGQAYPGLKKWNKHLELLGYRTEAVMRKAFVKGRMVSDAVMISCLFENYREIRRLRNGRFWMGARAMKDLLDNMPADGLVERLDALIREETEKYFKELKLY